MKEEELIYALSERTSVSKELAEQMINTVVDIIMETVSDGKKVRCNCLLGGCHKITANEQALAFLGNLKIVCP